MRGARSHLLGLVLLVCLGRVSAARGARDATAPAAEPAPAASAVFWLDRAAAEVPKYAADAGDAWGKAGQYSREEVQADGYGVLAELYARTGRAPGARDGYERILRQCNELLPAVKSPRLRPFILLRLARASALAGDEPAYRKSLQAVYATSDFAKGKDNRLSSSQLAGVGRFEDALAIARLDPDPGARRAQYGRIAVRQTVAGDKAAAAATLALAESDAEAAARQDPKLAHYDGEGLASDAVAAGDLPRARRLAALLPEQARASILAQIAAESLKANDRSAYEVAIAEAMKAAAAVPETEIPFHYVDIAKAKAAAGDAAGLAELETKVHFGPAGAGSSISARMFYGEMAVVYAGMGDIEAINRVVNRCEHAGEGADAKTKELSDLVSGLQGALTPTYPRIVAALAARGRFEDALAFTARAPGADPDEVQIMRAGVYATQGRTAEALACLANLKEATSLVRLMAVPPVAAGLAKAGKGKELLAWAEALPNAQERMQVYESAAEALLGEVRPPVRR